MSQATDRLANALAIGVERLLGIQSSTPQPAQATTLSALQAHPHYDHWYPSSMAEATAMIDQLDAEVTDIVNIYDTNTRRRRGIEVNLKLTRISEYLDALVDWTGPVDAATAAAKARVGGIVDRLLKELFGVTK